MSGITHSEQVERLIAGGAQLIQLREKHASPCEFYEAAAQAVRIARKHGVKIIINDRVDIALALRADGVHLGQDDLPPENARKILGQSVVIGYSTHTLQQALNAVKLPIDYVAIGPIFNTTSKNNPDPEVDLEGLQEVRHAIGNLPLVAIGGINAENIGHVLAAGADSAAIIGGIVSDPVEIEERMSALIKIVQQS